MDIIPGTSIFIVSTHNPYSEQQRPSGHPFNLQSPHTEKYLVVFFDKRMCLDDKYVCHHN